MRKMKEVYIMNILYKMYISRENWVFIEERVNIKVFVPRLKVDVRRSGRVVGTRRAGHRSDLNRHGS